MQTLQIVQLLDLKTNIWSVPYFVPSVPGWLRAIQDECNNQSTQHDFAKHPGDFQAWHTGTWNDETNKIEAPEARLLAKLDDLVINRH